MNFDKPAEFYAAVAAIEDDNHFGDASDSIQEKVQNSGDDTEIMEPTFSEFDKDILGVEKKKKKKVKASKLLENVHCLLCKLWWLRANRLH